MPSPVKLIAVDLDDTLLRRDLTISDRNVAALKAARRAGATVVLASGRNIYSMRPYALRLGLEGRHDLMICTNGAEILEVATGKPVYENRIPPSLCRELIEWLDAAGAAWQVYDRGRILVSRRNEWTEMDTRLTGQPCDLLTDREAIIAAGQLKLLAPAEPSEVERTLAGLKSHFGERLAVFTSKPYFLEILEPRSDKGIALERLASLLGIAREEVMAIGDAPNDLGMVRWAGWGCAPANARPEVKDAARLVAGVDHEGDAVAWLLGEIGAI